MFHVFYLWAPPYDTGVILSSQMFYLIRLTPPPEGSAVICAVPTASPLQNQSEVVGGEKYNHTAALQLCGPILMSQAILFYLHVLFKT